MENPAEKLMSELAEEKKELQPLQEKRNKLSKICGKNARNEKRYSQLRIW